MTKEEKVAFESLANAMESLVKESQETNKRLERIVRQLEVQNILKVREIKGELRKDIGGIISDCDFYDRETKNHAIELTKFKKMNLEKYSKKEEANNE